MSERDVGCAPGDDPSPRRSALRLGTIASALVALRTSLGELATKFPVGESQAWAIALVPAPGILGADGDVLGMVLTIVLLVLSLSFHEAAHAWTANKFGDSTGKDLGRITLNPLPHIDPMMSVLLPAALYWSSGGRFVFGGAKPVPVNFHRLRNPLRDMSLVALAGPLSNLLLAMFFLVAWKFFIATGLYNDAATVSYLRQDDRLPQLMVGAAFFNVVLGVFNLVPIPPLDGSRVMSWLLPENLRPSYDSLERFGLLIIIALSYLSPPFQRFLGRSIEFVIGQMERAVSLGGLW